MSYIRFRFISVFQHRSIMIQISDQLAHVAPPAMLLLHLPVAAVFLFCLKLLLLSFLSTFFVVKLFHAFLLGKSPSAPSPTTHDPPSHPFIGCLLSFFRNRHRLLFWYTDLLSKSPTLTIRLYRLGATRTVVTANPANVEYVLKTNFNNFPKGKPFTDVLGDFLGYGIFNVDGDLWRVQRKLASHEFSTKSLREFVVKTVDEELRGRLFPLLESTSCSNSTLDLQEVLKRFTFDTICKVSLGTDPCSFDLSQSLPPLLKSFETASEVCAMRGMAPIRLIWKLKRALNLGSEKRLSRAVKLIHCWVMDVMHAKKLKLQGLNCDNGNGVINLNHEDILSRLLHAGHNEEIIRDMVISFILAGRDATSAAMTWLFWLLSMHPHAEQTVLDELKSKETSSPDYEALKEMKFLKACLCETMRLYPPVVWDSKHAENDDVLPDGTPIKKGDRVTYFPFGMGRMESLWGEDRFEFKPERWFEEERPEVMKTVSPYKYPIFQAGPRVCLGKEMAFIQMKYIVASVIRRFEFVPVGSGRPAYVPRLTAHMAGGLHVKVRARSTGKER